MKNVLIVIQLVRRGGVELTAINLAVNLDKEKFKVSFLLLNPYEGQDNELLNELKQRGYEFFSIPENVNSYIDKYKYLCNFFKKHRFDIVHSHVILFSGIVLAAAKKGKVPVRVAHSHTTKWNNKENLKYKIYKAFMRLLLNRCSTRKLACSKAAGEFLYGKKHYLQSGIFIANGIDFEKFQFDPVCRLKTRNEFGVSEKELLIGHVGTIYKIKNQKYLIEIFSEILKINPNSKLMLVGEKADIAPVEEEARKLNVIDKVIFTGQLNNVADVYQAFDIMIFPSLHEALPVSLIEAQASKLPCLISDTVTDEVKYNGNVEFLSLKKGPEIWAAKALELIKAERETVDISLLRYNYDIKKVEKKLENIYSTP